MRLNLSKTGKIAALLVGTAFAATLASTAARADITGTLTCNIAPGAGIIVVSQRNVSCTYRSAVGPTEFYTGSISRLGVDIGTLDSGILTYNVYEGGTPTPGALAGNYFGPGVGITLGTGAGLNALVGGNANSISLQPIAAQTSTGVNVNAGVGNLNLNFAGVEAPLGHRHHMHRHHRRHM